MSSEELVAALSLRNLLPDSTCDDESDRLVREIGSPLISFHLLWMNVTDVFKESDTVFLAEIINGDIADGFNSQMVVALLIRVCFHNTSAHTPTLLDAYQSQLWLN